MFSTMMMNRVFLLLLICSLFYSVSHSETRYSLLGEGLSFISTDYDVDASKNVAFVGLSIKSDSAENDYLKTNTTFMFAAGNSLLSYLNLRETYYIYNWNESHKISFGRKLMSWSLLDSHWNLGAIQPQFRWNTLLPENQGLTGVFWDWKINSEFQASFFASGLYIPDQGPSYELKDGQFQSGNPWFSSPPQSIKFQGQLLPIDYNIEKPEVSSVVLQGQAGAQIKYGAGKGFFATASALMKPSNQLALAYKGVLVTTRVRVDVKPKVYFEGVAATDLGYKDDWGGVVFSALYTSPQNPSFESNYTAPQFSPNVLWGPQLLYKLKPFDLHLSYMGTSGEAEQDVGPDASSDRASLSQKFMFKEAAQIQLGYSDVLMNSFRWDAKLQYRHSTLDAFRQIRFKNVVDIKGPFAFWLDVLLIDADSEVASKIESFKNLDQLWAGLSYEL